MNCVALFTQSLQKELMARQEQLGALEQLVSELDGADGSLRQTVSLLHTDYDKTMEEVEVGWG